MIEEETSVRKTTMAVFLLIQLLAITAGAVERVAKLSNTAIPFGTTSTNQQTFYPGMPPQDYENLFFTVYTQQETDARVTRDEKIVAEMQEKIRILRENVQKLSDVNDALTKRIDDLEKRLAEKE